MRTNHEESDGIMRRKMVFMRKDMVSHHSPCNGMCGFTPEELFFGVQRQGQVFHGIYFTSNIQQGGRMELGVKHKYM